jgi:hypothetical protein
VLVLCGMFCVEGCEACLRPAQRTPAPSAARVTSQSWVSIMSCARRVLCTKARVCGKEEKRASTCCCAMFCCSHGFVPHAWNQLPGGSPENASRISSQGDLSELGDQSD